MSKTIDQKVVEMRFDNGQFEKGIAQSTNSINNLQSNLNKFSSGNFSSGLSSLSGNFVQFNNTINESGASFSALEEIAIGALRSIGGMVANVGQSIVTNLIGKIQAGFGRYEEMMKSTQTIMYATRDEWADQGEQMEYVNAQIEKLQWYADETSYGLTDMTSNVGKFISAGIPLEDAVTDMMGISSWAALSGQNAEAASRAMYNLSQAMAMGKVTMQDWRSIENANMATREFKNTAIEAGLAMGTLHEKADGTIYALNEYGKEVEVTVDNFRTTLAAGWFDSETLSYTLKQYGDFADQLALYTEATGLQTSDMLRIIDQVLNEVDIAELQDETLTNELNEYLASIARQEKLTGAEAEALGEAIIKLTDSEYELGRAAFKAGQESKTLTDSLDYTADALQTVWSNVFTNIVGDYLESKDVWTEFSEILYEQLVYPVEKFRDQLEYINNLGGFDKLKDALRNFYEVFSNIREAIDEGIEEVAGNKAANKALYFFQDLLKVSEKVKAVFHNFIDVAYYSDFENIKEAAAAVARGFEWLAWDVEVIGDAFSKAWKKIFPANVDDDLTLHIKEAAEAFEEFTKSLVFDSDNAEQLTRIFENILNVIDNLWTSLTNFGGAIAKAWKEIFPPKDAGDVIDGVLGGVEGVTKAISNLSDTFKITDERAEKIKRAFKGLFAILDILKSLFVAILSPIMGINVETGEMGDGLFDVAAAIGDWLVGVRDWLAENKIFETAVQKVTEFLQNIPVYAEQASQALFGMSLAELWDTVKEKAMQAWDALKQFFGWLVGMFSKSGEEGEEYSESVSEGITEGFTEEKSKPITEFFGKLTEGFDSFKEKWEEAKPYIDEFLNMFKENIEFPDFDELAEGGKKLSTIAILAGIAAIIWKFVRALTNLDKDKEKIVNSVKYMFTSIGDAAKALKKNIQAQTFKTYATAILELAAAIFVLALLPTEKMNQASAVIVVLMMELGLMFKEITSIQGDEKKLNQMTKLFMSLAVVLAVMIGGIVAIALTTDIDEAGMATLMIIGMMAMFAELLKELDHFDVDRKQMRSITLVMEDMAVLIVAMGAAILIATLAGDAMAIAAAGLTISLMINQVTNFFETIDKVKADNRRIRTLLQLVESIGVLVIAMGAALLIATMGGADWKSLAAAGTVMSGMMMTIALAMKVMPDKNNIQEMAAGLLTASIAFVMMGAALSIAVSNGADWKALAVAGTVMAGMILALALAFKIMPDNAKLMSAAAGLMVASVGLIMLAGALAIVGQLNLGQVGTALLGLAGALVIILVAGAAASYVGGGLLILGAALALIGAGAMMAGAGLWLVADAMQTLFSLDPAGVNTMMMALTMFFSMLPFFLQQVAVGILAFLEVFVNARQLIFEMFVGTFGTILDAYLTIMPKVVQAVTETIVQILQAYRQTMPLVIAAVTETIIAILDACIQLLPKVFEFLTELFYQIIAFTIETTPPLIETIVFVLQSIFDAFVAFTYKNLPTLIDLVTFVVTELVRSIVETTSVIVAGLIAMLIDILTQVKDNIAQIVELAVEIGIEIIVGLLDGLAEGIPRLANAGIDCLLAIINGIADGLEDRADDIRDTMNNVALSLLNAFKTILGIKSPSTVFSDIGGNIMQGLIDGISDMISKVKETISGVAETVSSKFKELLGIASPSKVFAQYGKFIDEGLSRGMQKNTWMVSDATEEVGDAAIDGMSKVISDISEVVENGIDYQPTIRPVLDLTNVTEGIDTMNGMLSDSSAVDLASSNSDMINGKISRLDAFSMSLDSIREALGHNKKGDRGFGTQNNTFNITGDNPKEIANQVNYILQQQVERKEAVWAH